MSAKYGILNLDSILNFGRWRGEKLYIVIDADPEYISWCIKENLIEFDNVSYQIYESVNFA